MTDSNSVRTFSTPLVDALLRKYGGVFDRVLPTTACTSASGINERKFLAERFHIDLVVTSHDPKCPNFSFGTSIHESLVICCRRNKDERRQPTTFVALRQMPRTADEVGDWLATFDAGKLHPLHRLCDWSSALVAEGDWTPCQYWDGRLAALARHIDAFDATTPLGSLALAEPGGQQLRDAFLNPLGQSMRHGGYPVVWTHETNERRTMRSFADYDTEPKPAKREYATDVLWPKASRLLVACKIRASEIRVAAIHTPVPVLGLSYIPVTPLPSVEHPAETLTAWAAYLNSTPAVLSFLNRRQKALDYSDYSLDQLRSVPVPDPAKCDLAPLTSAFRDLGDAELLPWPRMNECPVRARLDAAAGECLGLRPETVADWRERIVGEPTVSNRPADPFEEPRDLISFLMSGPSLEGLDLERDRSPPRDIQLPLNVKVPTDAQP